MTKFDKKMITPHVGWNYVNVSNSKIIKKNENKFYFIHSYYATPKYKEDIFVRHLIMILSFAQE